MFWCLYLDNNQQLYATIQLNSDSPCYRLELEVNQELGVMLPTKISKGTNTKSIYLGEYDFPFVWEELYRHKDIEKYRKHYNFFKSVLNMMIG